MGSAQGVVQDLGYIATFPLLLNISGEPTYFIPLKDQANLVKSYAMVNVARYDIVATADTVTACEQEYIRLLSERGVTQEEELPQNQASGVIAEIRSAVLEGNTCYFIRLEGEDVFYSVSAAQNEAAVILNPGDQVTLSYGSYGEITTDILSGCSIVSYTRSSLFSAENGTDAAAPQDELDAA